MINTFHDLCYNKEHIIYLNYTNKVVPKNIDELKKNVDKLKSTISESINQLKSSTKKAIEKEIDK